MANTYAEATKILDPNGAFNSASLPALVTSAQIATAQSGGASIASLGLYIRAIINRTGFVRVYDPTLGVGNLESGPVGYAAATNLPLLTNLIVRSQHDDAAPWYSDPNDANPAKIGMIELFLQPSASDAVTAASPQTFKTDASTIVIVATGTSA